MARNTSECGTRQLLLKILGRSAIKCEQVGCIIAYQDYHVANLTSSLRAAVLNVA